MSTEIMEALENGLEKYFGKMSIAKTWTIEDVCYYLGLSRSQFDRTVRNSEGFPLPRKVSDSLRWKPAEVMDWFDKQKVLKVGRKRA